MTLDVSRAPRGVMAATTLVYAVAKVGDLAERHYLELKGPTDLKSKASKQKVAKFILGAANRMPERALEAFEGCAVMILGITAEGVVGLPPMEMLELNKVVEPYLGPDGPRWDIVRVGVPGSANEVLVVVVEPPLSGQRAWICRANGDGLVDGRVYFRADGETREATSAEQDLLRRRGETVSSAVVDLGVRITNGVTPIVVDPDLTLEPYISVMRRQLLNNLPDYAGTSRGDRQKTIDDDGSGTHLSDREKLQDSLSTIAGTSTLGGWSNVLPEDRTVKQYEQQIDDWEMEFRSKWDDIVLRFGSYLASQNEVEVSNRTTTFLHDVEVRIHLDGAIVTAEPRQAPHKVSELDIDIPSTPRPWGPKRKDLLAGLGAAPPLYIPAWGPGPIGESKSDWRTSGSVDVDVQVGDLRPEAAFRTDDEESVLMVLGTSSTTVAGTWRATIRGYNDVFAGTLNVEIEEPIELTSLIRRYLRLDDRENGAHAADA